MEQHLSLLVYILLMFLGLAIFGWVLVRRFQRLVQQNRDNQSFLLIQQEIDQLRGQLGQVLDGSSQRIQQQLGQVLGHVNERLKENSDVLQKTQQALGERLDNAARIVGHVQKSLGSLEEANRTIYEVGKDIASLQDILRAPKLRGGFGEFFLTDLLSQILPPEHFSTQYSFKSGEKVDAVIKLGGSLVPVDSKFPLKNFKRILEAATADEKMRARKQFVSDVKKHVVALPENTSYPMKGRMTLP